jgi:hypothetical protein
MVGFKRLKVFIQDDGLFSITWCRLKYSFFSEITLKRVRHAGPMRSEKQEFSSLSKTEKIGSDKDRGRSDRSIWFKDYLN